MACLWLANLCSTKIINNVAPNSLVIAQSTEQKIIDGISKYV